MVTVTSFAHVMIHERRAGEFFIVFCSSEKLRNELDFNNFIYLLIVTQFLWHLSQHI